MGTFAKNEIGKEQLLDMMAGGAEIQSLVAELEGRSAA
jgi:simple sugar transport system ATP-binding protein